jgi:hypothetical protein
MSTIRVPTEAEKVALEALVDSVGLVQTVELLSAICHEKVAHLAENWQDNKSDQVTTWKRNATKLEKNANSLWRQAWERE